MKKCKVVIVPVEDNDYKNHTKYPITNHKGNIRSSDYWGFLPLNIHFAHIEFRDENNFLVATTDKTIIEPCDGITNDNFPYPSIPQSFIDEFIASNGEIKETMIKTELKTWNGRGVTGRKITYNEFLPKLTSSREIIIHPIKTEMKISDIPVDAIKNLLAPLDARNKDFCIIAKWLEDNNL